MPPSSIDPPRPPQAPLARLLAEAALQRQGMLLGADRADGAAQPASALPQGLPSALPLPQPSTDRVSVSPEARARATAQEAAAGRPAAGAPGAAWQPAAGAAGGAGEAAGRSASLPGRPLAGAPLGTPLPSPAAGAEAGAVAGADEAWPAGGVAGPMRTLLGLLAHRLGEGGGGAAVRVVAAQPWTAGLAQGLRNALAAQGGAAAALQTWRVGQGSVLAQDGERGFAFTLQVPTAWAERGAAAAASAAGAAAPAAGAPGTAGPNAAGGATPSLALPFPGRMGRLDSGVFALVLQQGAGESGAAGRTSALLSLEFQPPPQAALYGREWMQQAAMRTDPWLQMAALQAGGWRPEDEEAEAAARRGAVPPCDQPGCPYEGRAPCEQPFCLALRVEPRRPA